MRYSLLSSIYQARVNLLHPQASSNGKLLRLKSYTEIFCTRRGVRVIYKKDSHQAGSIYVKLLQNSLLLA